MVFSSIAFLCYFLPIFLLVYYFLPKGLKNYFIFFASILFYSWGAPKFVFILLGSTFIDFFLVAAMDREHDASRKKALLALSIFINVGLLAYFKYANFFIENVNGFLGSMGMEALTWTKVLLPIGISFYTFQTLTYSIDVYRKVHPPLKKVTDYMLYIMMFPQLIAGPIVRFNEIADQITDRENNIDDWLVGFFRFIIGLSKKVLVANVMAVQATAIMGQEDFSQLDTATAWLGAFAYTFQIYFDFSGYSDMAIGLGRMMGFKFPENFDSPYISKSISEFWRRWHITLGTWMRDYLYIPLGGNRVSPGRLYFNLWLVFLISGLWHGASWNFVLWGAFHGLFLILDRLFLLDLLRKLGSIPATVFTFFVVVLGWVLFRIENMADALIYYQRMFAFDFGPANFSLSGEFKLVFLFAILFSFWSLLPRIKDLTNLVYFRKHSRALTLGLMCVCTLLYVFSISTLATTDFNPFIYFRF